jgi:HTH-type transcriptional regulator, glycine betaine synthesis regulator
MNGSAAILAPASAPPQGSIEEIEDHVIALFIDLVRWFGAPKSVGAIYGLLFISKDPLSFDQIATRLEMSNGSVSQSLRMLKSVGAAHVALAHGDRRDFYVAEVSLRRLAGVFLTFHLHERLATGEERTKTLLVASQNSHPDFKFDRASFVAERIERLNRWYTQAKGGLPVILKMLDV